MIDENKIKDCESCIYFCSESQSPYGNCFRFARFVDHAINDYSRDCEYWAGINQAAINGQ